MSDSHTTVRTDAGSVIDVVSVQMLNGRWESRFRNQHEPVGYGASLKESAQDLLIHHLPLKAHRRPVVIEERFDPFA